MDKAHRWGLTEKLGVVVAAGGCLVIAGWIWDIPALKSVLARWPSMKISTAISFVMSGIILYFIPGHLKKTARMSKCWPAATSPTMSVSSAWTPDTVGMAMQTIMLAAKSIGYDSCPMIGFDIDKVAKLIHLPSDHVMGPMIAIGKRTKDSWPKPGQLPLSDVVIENTF